MRLLDTCLLSLSAASFIIGVHQIITIGFAQGYWLIMLSSALLLWFGIRKKNNSSVEADPSNSSGKKKPHRASSRRASSRRASSRRASSRRKKKSR